MHLKTCLIALLGRRPAAWQVCAMAQQKSMLQLMLSMMLLAATLAGDAPPPSPVVPKVHPTLAGDAPPPPPVVPKVHPMHNGGTPGGIPPKTDCNLRAFVWEAGKKLMPRRGSFKTLFDAMQLDACGVEGPNELDAWHPPAGSPVSPAGKVLYVDATNGSDSAAGSQSAPLKTIGAAIDKATEHLANSGAESAKATVVLRKGVYHGCDGKGHVCRLGPAQSGLTITNEAGEDATVTGGEPLAIAASDWKPVHKTTPAGGTKWKDMKGMNDVADRAGNPTPSSDTKCCKFLGIMTTDTLDACKAAAVSAGGNFAGVTYHTAAFAGPYARHCYGVHHGEWLKPAVQAKIDSSQNITAGEGYGAPVWVADLNKLPGGKPANFDGLRLGTQRAIRAKYPNGDPEKSGEWYIMGASQAMGGGEYSEGWDVTPTTWLPHRAWGRPPQHEVVITGADWPGVEWPMDPPGGPSNTWTGEGDWGEFHAGYGGTCDDVDPPFGYWCAKKPPRGISQHWSPSGLVWADHLQKGANYTNPEDAVVVAWRGGGRWLTYIWCAIKNFLHGQTA